MAYKLKRSATTGKLLRTGGNKLVHACVVNPTCTTCGSMGSTSPAPAVLRCAFSGLTPSGCCTFWDRFDWPYAFYPPAGVWNFELDLNWHGTVQNPVCLWRPNDSSVGAFTGISIEQTWGGTCSPESMTEKTYSSDWICTADVETLGDGYTYFTLVLQKDFGGCWLPAYYHRLKLTTCAWLETPRTMSNQLLVAAPSECYENQGCNQINLYTGGSCLITPLG